MVNFLHFSDFHIQERKGILKEGVDPCLKLKRVIEVAREMDVKPAFSILTGDISQDGSEEGYVIANEYFREIEALGGPVLPAMGNVDGRKNFSRLLLGGSGDDPCFYSRTLGGLHVIILNSQTPGGNTGSFGDVQLKWLEKEVWDAPEPCVIAFHHPVFDAPFLSELVPPIFDLGDAKRFREIMEGGNVLGVFCGHLHQCMSSMEGGVSYVMSGSVFSEASYNAEEKRLHEASGFNFLSYEGGTLTVRPVVFSEGRKLIYRNPREGPENR
jgi:3',5'-cyclic AMP phosphodiesterase CpdA